MRIREVMPEGAGLLHIVAEDGREGVFDVTPYLAAEAFHPLAQEAEFRKVRGCGYFVEWPCGADLSADTIEARWRLIVPAGSPEGERH